MRSLFPQLAGGLGLFAACARSEPPKLDMAPVPSAPARESAATAAIASVLTGVRSRASLAAPTWEEQPLAFGQKLFARLVPDGLEVFSLPALSSVMTHPLEGARGVLEIAGGSLVAVGVKQALRVDPGAKAPVRLPPVPWLPGTLLLPERRDSHLLWSIQTVGKVLVRQRLELDPTRSFDKEVTLEGYDGGALTALRDGTLLYTAAGGVRRALPEGRPHRFTTELRPWRLLPGRRIDQAWAVAGDGAVELWQLADRMVVQRRFLAGAAPFAAAASQDYLALVLIDEAAGAPRRFRLVVYDDDAKVVCERPLAPGEPEAGEDWAERAVQNRHVALSDGEPFVAVGGTGAVAVYRLPGGEVVLER